MLTAGGGSSRASTKWPMQWQSPWVRVVSLSFRWPAVHAWKQLLHVCLGCEQTALFLCVVCVCACECVC